MTPRRKLEMTHDCAAVRDIIGRVGDKWSVYIFKLLADGSMRFNEIKRSIDGISQRMLTLTLRALERDGLVLRTVTPTIPPRVDYALTPLGATLIDTMKTFGAWAQANAPAIHAARERFDKRQAKLEGAEPARTAKVPAPRRTPTRAPRRATP